MPVKEKRVLLPEDLNPIQSLEGYQAQGGLEGLEKARGMKPKDVIEEIRKSGLRGRGGAGFPTGVKWMTTDSEPSSKKYLVCNLAEGEPGTYKDRYLISKNPYQLIEGVLIASYAVNAQLAVIGTKAKFKSTIERMQHAIREMENAGLMPKGNVRLVLGPDDYLLGEEKALLEVIDGGGAMPRIMPPYVQGIYCTPPEYNPTVVNNAETLSHVSHILAKGADWFRSSGSKDTPGTMIFTLSGDVKRPGMYEFQLGLTLRDLLNEVGGGPVGKDPFLAVFSGVANCVITPDVFDTPLDFGSMRNAGVGLGSAGFIVYDQSRCIVKIALMLSRFLAASSCGQCVPCQMGCRSITRYLQNLEEGRGTQQDMDNILRECGLCTNQTRCFLPTQESKMISSLLSKFPQQFFNHINQGCKNMRELVLPKIESFDEKSGQFKFESHPKEMLEFLPVN